MACKQLLLKSNTSGMTVPFTQVAFFFQFNEMVKVWINHFKVDYEKSLMLDQTFDLHLNRL